MIKEIALLGQDGIGKTTISNALQSSLEDLGCEVAVVSWTKFVKGQQTPSSTFSKNCLEDLYCTSYRGMYGAAKAQTTRAVELFPAGTSAFFSEQASDAFLALDITENAPWGVLAGALAEMSGNYFFRHLEVEERINRGMTVVQETYGYKHIVKELFVARELAILNGQEEYLPVIDVIDAASEKMFSTVLAPEFGFVIDCDPEVAHARRVSQGGVGWTEDMQLACDRGPGSFVKMQKYSRDKFLGFAQRHGWPVIRTDQADETETVRHAIEVILATARAGVPA